MNKQDKYKCPKCGYYPMWETFMTTYTAYYCPHCGYVKYDIS